MHYNKLGKAGIKLSELSLGSWVTFVNQVDFSEAKKLMHLAFDHGINFFDNAEAYAHGASETLMGKVLKDFRREDLVVSTKIFWGGEGPNDRGLSRKHLIEGTKNSLKRLQLDYVDLLFCHRPDLDTPLEETVLAMDALVRGGQAFYWGTSEWPAIQIESAFQIAEKLNCIPPSMEQPKYNLFYREHLEKDYLPLFKKHQLGTTIWSPLASGVLSGKYNQGIPKDSRFAREPHLIPENLNKQIEQVKELAKLALDLGGTVGQLALAWCLMNPHVSSVITGASRVEQLMENLGALQMKPKLTPELMKTINKMTMKESAY